MDTRNHSEEIVFSPSAGHVPRDEKVTIEKRPELGKNILDRQKGVNRFGTLDLGIWLILHFPESGREKLYSF
jgi:hypothetical protein